MTTITFESDIAISKNNFVDLEDFLQALSENYDFSYEEYLEQKMKYVQNAPKSDFVNL